MVDPREVPNEALQVHLCGPEDREEQARLFNRCFKKAVEPANLRWRYDQSPFGGSVSLVSRPPGGEGICGYACSPRAALSFGDPKSRATVGQTGDVMTDPDWRKRGIFSSLDRACMEETGRLGWPVVFGLPNRRSAHIFIELGWHQVGTLRPWTFLFAGDARGRSLRSREGRLAGWKAPIDAWRLGGARKRRRASLSGEFQIEPLERFPVAVGELSRLVEERFPLMVPRTADYLNWRFVDTPLKAHRVLGAWRGEELAGYVVVQPPRDSTGVGHLVDVLAPDEAALAALLEAGLDALEASGAVAAQATAIDGSFWNQRLVATGFLPPKPENHLIVIAWIHDAEHPLGQAARDASSWYLTDGDRDDETVG